MNKKLKSSFALLAVLGIFALVGAGAVGTAVTSDSARPGDALYGIDRAMENLRLSFADSPEAQARVHNEIALERLVEAQSLANVSGRTAHVQEALTLARGHLDEVMVKAQEAQAQGKDVDDILALLAENHLRQQEVLQEVYEKVPEQAKASIQRAIEQSQKGYEMAVRTISEESREELLQGTRARLENARNKAEEQGIELPNLDLPDLPETEDVHDGNGEPPSDIPTTTSVLTQEETLSEAGITPDSPLYFLDTLGENLGLFFAFGHEAKTRKATEIAGEKVAEVKAMAEEGNADAAEEAVGRYGVMISTAAQNLAATTQSGEGVHEALVKLVAQATSVHLSVLADVYEPVPEQTKSSIESAIQHSERGATEALNALGDEGRPDVDQVRMEVQQRIEEARQQRGMPEGVGQP